MSKEAKERHFKKARLNFQPKLLVDVLELQKNKLLKKSYLKHILISLLEENYI
jgi:hypothetical protein